MADDKLESAKVASGQVDALQNQLGSMLSGVEKSLAVTCESIMGKMSQLEEKIQEMEKRYTDLAKDAENAIKEAEKTPATTGLETVTSQSDEAAKK